MTHPDQHPLRQEQAQILKPTEVGEVGLFLNDLWYSRVPDDQAREMAEKEFGPERMAAYDAWQEEIRKADEAEEAQKNAAKKE